MKKNLFVLSGAGLALAPMFAFAQTSSNCAIGSGGTLSGILCQVGNLLNSVMPVIIALGVVYFIWGVVSYVVGSDEEAKKKGRDRIIYGIIGLVVIVSIWGLVAILKNTFGLKGAGDTYGTLQVPCIPSPGVTC